MDNLFEDDAPITLCHTSLGPVMVSSDNLDRLSQRLPNNYLTALDALGKTLSDGIVDGKMVRSGVLEGIDYRVSKDGLGWWVSFSKGISSGIKAKAGQRVLCHLSGRDSYGTVIKNIKGMSVVRLDGDKGEYATDDANALEMAPKLQ